MGTPQLLTDQSQQIVWQASYNPFGEATITTATVENNIRFPGQYLDSETNLHYNYFRYYDPSVGRYITSDSIGLMGGINSYSYALQNPINYYDPNGQLAANAAAAAGGAVFGGVAGFFGELIYQYGKCNSFAGVDWWSVTASTAFGAIGGAVTGATFGAVPGVTLTAGYNAGAAIAPGLLIGNVVGTTRGVVEHKFNPEYPLDDCDENDQCEE